MINYDAMGIIERQARLIEQEIGDSTPFFNAMDAWLAQERFYELQVGRMIGIDAHIVVTGRWGRSFAEWYGGGVLVMPGDLRHERQIQPAQSWGHAYEHYVMLDNSCYKGRTRDKVKTWLEIAGATLVATYVLYDGSLKPIPGISGVFRYHDD